MWRARASFPSSSTGTPEAGRRHSLPWQRGPLGIGSTGQPLSSIGELPASLVSSDLNIILKYIYLLSTWFGIYICLKRCRNVSCFCKCGSSIGKEVIWRSVLCRELQVYRHLAGEFVHPTSAVQRQPTARLQLRPGVREARPGWGGCPPLPQHRTHTPHHLLSKSVECRRQGCEFTRAAPQQRF